MCFRRFPKQPEFFPDRYEDKKFTFYSAEEIELSPDKKVTYAYSFVIDKDAPIFFIAPGGGYANVCIGYEGVFIAEELNRHGINAFVLNYRVGRPASDAPHPQEDMASLIKYVFSHKKEFGITRERYSVLGFSAGGHLAASFCTENVGYAAFGLPKPDLAVLCYAVITMGKGTHEGTMKNLTGGNADLREAYSVEKHADGYPPTFLWHCKDDRCVPVSNPIKMYDELTARNIPAKLVLYKRGGHGLGLARKTEAENWMKEMLSFAKDFI